MQWLPWAGSAQVPPQPAFDAPPLRQPASVTGEDAPTVLNAGHDFVLLNWPPRPVEGHLYRPAGHRVYAARWKPSFVARYAPDLSGRYEWDGETLDVCTVQDGVLGEGRMAAYLHSQDGGFSAIATGRWSVAQGGYAGVMIHSNDTTHSGPLLLYGHRDGSVRVRSGAFYYSPETLRDMAPSFPRMVPVFRGVHGRRVRPAAAAAAPGTDEGARPERKLPEQLQRVHRGLHERRFVSGRVFGRRLPAGLRYGTLGGRGGAVGGHRGGDWPGLTPIHVARGRRRALGRLVGV